VSELSFRLYAEGLSGNELLDGERLDDSAKIRELAAEVREYISHLDLLLDYHEIQPGEIHESVALGKRLRDYFRHYERGHAIVARPQFLGCGIIDPCEGDLLAGTTLYEVKNVERDFRLADLRQLLCYCALNAASPTYKIDNVGLVNARGGVYYIVNLNALCLAAGGTSATALLSEIANYISVDRPSR
jgi:hypothetical protein